MSGGCTFSSKLNIRKQRKLLWSAKLYLMCLYFFVFMFALLDGHGIAFYPIELSALLTRFYMRKAIFLAGITPISVLLWVLRPDSWQLRGMGVGLFLMSLFDERNEWPLHLASVLLFGVCLFYNTDEKIPKRNRTLQCVVLTLLYVIRILLRTLYLYIYETPGRSNQLAVLGCGDGGHYCRRPELTPVVLKTVASLQLIIFILLSVISNE